jgi:hypothetical protein
VLPGTTTTEAHSVGHDTAAVHCGLRMSTSVAQYAWFVLSYDSQSPKLDTNAIVVQTVGGGRTSVGTGKMPFVGSPDGRVNIWLMRSESIISKKWWRGCE